MNEFSDKTSSDVLERGFWTLVLNWTRRDGILAPGTAFTKVGEDGKGLASRQYPKTLADRLHPITASADRIPFSKGGGMASLESALASTRPRAQPFWILVPPEGPPKHTEWCPTPVAEDDIVAGQCAVAPRCSSSEDRRSSPNRSGARRKEKFRGAEDLGQEIRGRRGDRGLAGSTARDDRRNATAADAPSARYPSPKPARKRPRWRMLPHQARGQFQQARRGLDGLTAGPRASEGA